MYVPSVFNLWAPLWTLPGDGRVLMVTPAWFATYRPRQGLASTLATLGDADDPDTAVALFMPPRLAAQLHWKGGRLWVASTLRAWLQAEAGKVLTFGAYTAELEADVFCSALE